MAASVYGMHHIGITVPDIEEGIDFFTAIFGAVEVFRTGPFDVDATFMKEHIGASEHSRILDLVFLKCGTGTSVELFQYDGEDKNATVKRPSEIGGMHLCFEVEDVLASAERLREAGAEMLKGPNLVEGGPLKGFHWVFCRSSWGLLVEIASFDKLGYENSSDHRIWRAKDFAS
jgi:catechol 2,3-dioxygenase-like lactoylglutathione lyase family enzyme